MFFLCVASQSEHMTIIFLGQDPTDVTTDALSNLTFETLFRLWTSVSNSRTRHKTSELH